MNHKKLYGALRVDLKDMVCLCKICDNLDKHPTSFERMSTVISYMWYVVDSMSFMQVHISLQFILHTIYGPPNHSGGTVTIGLVSTKHGAGARRAFNLDEIGVDQLVCAWSRCSPSKGGNNFQRHSNSRNSHFGSHINFNELEN